MLDTLWLPAQQGAAVSRKSPSTAPCGKSRGGRPTQMLPALLQNLYGQQVPPTYPQAFQGQGKNQQRPPSSPMDTTSPIITTVGTVSNHRVGLHARCGTVHVAAETRGAALSTRGEAKRQDGDARRGAALSTRGEAKRRDGDTRSQALKCSNNV